MLSIMSVFVVLSVLAFLCLRLDFGETQFHSAVHYLLYGLNDNKVHFDFD